jgi:hypothetical protein
MTSDSPRSLKTIALWATALAMVWTVSCLGIAWWRGLPEPGVHDKFAYLLGGDTFAHGRLANAPHPLSRFFQEPHVLAEPTKASKYPPGQSLALSLGEVLFGHPYFGVVISGRRWCFCSR